MQRGVRISIELLTPAKDTMMPTIKPQKILPQLGVAFRLHMGLSDDRGMTQNLRVLQPYVGQERTMQA